MRQRTETRTEYRMEYNVTVNFECLAYSVSSEVTLFTVVRRYNVEKFKLRNTEVNEEGYG